MADERVDSEIVTQFLLNTCRLRPQLTKHAIQAAERCVYEATHHPVDDVEADVIPFTTGSVAEFYIEPMLPHVGDIDVMYYKSTFLAIAYHEDIHRRRSYQMSFTTTSRYMRLSTVTYQATCT